MVTVIQRLPAIPENPDEAVLEREHVVLSADLPDKEIDDYTPGLFLPHGCSLHSIKRLNASPYFTPFDHYPSKPLFEAHPAIDPETMLDASDGIITRLILQVQKLATHMVERTDVETLETSALNASRFCRSYTEQLRKHICHQIKLEHHLTTPFERAIHEIDLTDAECPGILYLHSLSENEHLIQLAQKEARIREFYLNVSQILFNDTSEVIHLSSRFLEIACMRLEGNPLTRIGIIGEGAQARVECLDGAEDLVVKYEKKDDFSIFDQSLLEYGGALKVEEEKRHILEPHYMCIDHASIPMLIFTKMETTLKLCPEVYSNEDALSQVVQNILPALIKLHSKNCVHMDIKSDNIFMNSDGTFLLGDFGSVTRTGIYGQYTLFSTPPEICKGLPLHGRLLLTEKADMWQLGGFIFSCLTSRSTLLGVLDRHLTSAGYLESEEELSLQRIEKIYAQIEATPELLDEVLSAVFSASDVDHPIHALMRHCLTLDPRDRISSSDALTLLRS